MINADYNDKPAVIEILSKSFNDNQSVNYIIIQDRRKELRLEKLMEYSFEVCYRYGKVFLSNDKKGCALIVLPEKKEVTLHSIYLDLKLIFCCIGLSNIKKAISRELKIKRLQAKDKRYYLWFIGVHPESQHQGTGGKLLNEIIEKANSEQRIICLETSVIRNIQWYEKFGFSIYNKLNFGYDLFFLKN